MPQNSPFNDAHSLKRYYKDITLDLPLCGEENQESTPVMNLPLSGEEKSKVNADDERDYKKKASIDTRANCKQNTTSGK